jgi:Arc/MetJ-type ribon-helix-helix transcriptional regulator
MTIHLPEPLESSVLAAVHSGHFASVDDAMAEAARLLLRQLKHGQEAASPPLATTQEPPAKAFKPIWEEIEEITAGIPDEEFLKLPVDGAEQHDHYIYGTPKRPPSQ